MLPEQDAVVATTAATAEMQAILDAVWAHLLPALGASTPDAAPQAELASRLAELELPAYRAEPAPSDWAPWLPQPFTVSGASDGELTLTAVGVGRDDAGPRITVEEAENALSLAVGTSGWTVSTPVDRSGTGIPVAAAGGWVDPKTLRVEVIFLETPHRLDVVCSLDDRRASVGWRVPPLGGTHLQELRSPV